MSELTLDQKIKILDDLIKDKQGQIERRRRQNLETAKAKVAEEEFRINLHAELEIPYHDSLQDLKNQLGEAMKGIEQIKAEMARLQEYREDLLNQAKRAGRY
jgi:uncharacterized membrane protein